MPANYISVNAQIEQAAPELRMHRQKMAEKSLIVRDLLENLPMPLGELKIRAERVCLKLDRMFRSAGPLNEPISNQYPQSGSPSPATLVAVDGSSLAPDAQSDFGVINIATVFWDIQENLPVPPKIEVETSLFLENNPILDSGSLLSEESITLLRDTSERLSLAEAISSSPKSAIKIGLLDGPLELWSAKQSAGPRDFSAALARVRTAYQQMTSEGAIFAGFVDSTRGNLLVHLLEIALVSDDDLKNVRAIQPLRGMRDMHILTGWLRPGCRTAVFRLLSRSQAVLNGDLAVCFYYLNCGDQDYENIARIEIPFWIAEKPQLIEELSVHILRQTSVVPGVPAPYALIRADEACRLTRVDRAAIQQLLIQYGGERAVPGAKTQAKILTGARL